MLGDSGEGRAKVLVRRAADEPMLSLAVVIVLAALFACVGTFAQQASFHGIGVFDRVLAFGQIGPPAVLGFLVLPVAALALTRVGPRDGAPRRLILALRVGLGVVSAAALASCAYGVWVVLTRIGFGDTDFRSGLDASVRIGYGAMSAAGLVLAATALWVTFASRDHDAVAPPRALRTWRVARPTVVAVLLAAAALIDPVVEPLFRKAPKVQALDLGVAGTPVVTAGGSNTVGLRLWLGAVEFQRNPIALLALGALLLILAAHHRNARTNDADGLAIAGGVLGALGAIAAVFVLYRDVVNNVGRTDLVSGVWQRVEVAASALASGVLGAMTCAVAMHVRGERIVGDEHARSAAARVPIRQVAVALGVAGVGFAVFIGVVLFTNHHGAPFGDVSLELTGYDLVAVGVAFAAVLAAACDRTRSQASFVVSSLMSVIAGVALFLGGYGFWYALWGKIQSPLLEYESASQRHVFAATALAGALLALGVLSVVWSSYNRAADADDDTDPGDDEIPVVELQPS